MTAVSKTTPPTHYRIGLLNSVPPPQAWSDSLSPHTCLNLLFIATARGLRLQNLDSGFRRQKHFFGSQLQLYNLILLFQRALHCNVEFGGGGEGGFKLLIVCTSSGSERWLENQNLDSAGGLDQSNIKICSRPNTLLFSEEVTSHEQNLKEGTEMWQAEAHIYSSGSRQLRGGSLGVSLLKKSGSIVICMKADSTSTFAPSNGSCLFDGWAGRAVSWQVRDSEPAWSARFWQAVCLDLLLWRAIAQKAFVISRA